MSKLYVVATPIGNLGDITNRALMILEEVQLILAEDTRTTRKFFTAFPDRQFNAQVLRLDDSVKGMRLYNIIDQIAEGVEAALVSESGTPQVNDPGHLLIKKCIKRGIQIVPVPGPSSLTSIISVADFPAQPILFFGFLPRKKGRQTTFEHLSCQLHKSQAYKSIVIYESPYRVLKTLDDIAKYFGDETHLVIGREMTKKFEEIWYGTVIEALEYFSKPKGEFVILIQVTPSAKR
jgi:16S rRNA (cytidine1402-2'-O)-methyltransferase